jgi:hypothetical protein
MERVKVKIHAFLISTPDGMSCLFYSPAAISSLKDQFDRRTGPKTGPERMVAKAEYLALTKFEPRSFSPLLVPSVTVILVHLCLQRPKEIIRCESEVSDQVLKNYN